MIMDVLKFKNLVYYCFHFLKYDIRLFPYLEKAMLKIVRGNSVLSRFIIVYKWLLEK